MGAIDAPVRLCRAAGDTTVTPGMLHDTSRQPSGATGTAGTSLYGHDGRKGLSVASAHFFPLPLHVAAAAEISDGAKVVYGALAFHARTSGTCWPSHELLAREGRGPAWYKMPGSSLVRYGESALLEYVRAGQRQPSRAN